MELPKEQGRVPKEQMRAQREYWGTMERAHGQRKGSRREQEVLLLITVARCRARRWINGTAQSEESESMEQGYDNNGFNT